MKQVICTFSGSIWWSYRNDAPNIGPSYFEICNVLKEVEEDGEMGYILEGYDQSEPYHASFFIPLIHSRITCKKYQEELEMV